MQVARRVYVYLITFISLMVLLAGASNLLRLLFEMGLGSAQDVINTEYLRDQFSLWGALLLVGGAVWAIHWMLAQRSVAPSNPEAEQERRSVLRKLLIYAVLFVTLWQVFFALRDLLQALGRLIFGQRDQTLSAIITDTVPQLLVYGVAWLYYWRVRTHDNAVSPEQGREATVRRWYFYLACFVTLSVLMGAASDLARLMWKAITENSQPILSSGGEGTLRPVIGDIATIMTVAAIWLLHWLRVQRLTAVSRDEQHSALRKVYLYGVVLQTVAVSVTSLAFFLYNLLRMVLGSNPLAESGESLLTAAGGPLLTAVVYGVFWAYHWRTIKWDSTLVSDERPLQASIRRIYYHLVALIGLSVLAVGVASLLRLLIDLWLGGNATTNLNRGAWGDQISFAATMIVAGGPVWAFHWLRLQRWAMAPDGAEDRHSLARRVYLYIVLFFSVITLLSSGVWLLYQLFRNFGEPIGSDLLNQISWALGAAISAAMLLAYHLQLMIGDQRARAAVPPQAVEAERMMSATLVLVRGEEATKVGAALVTAQNELPAGVQVDVFPANGLTPSELRAWLAGRPARTPTSPPSPTPPAEPEQPERPAGTNPMPA